MNRRRVVLIVAALAAGLFSAPEVHANSAAAACQQMQSLAAQNWGLYNQYRDPAHMRAAQSYEAHARQCWAAANRATPRYGGGGGNRRQQQLGAAMGILGALADLARQMEEQRRAENHRLADEANREGNALVDRGDDEGAMLAYQRALGYLQANDDPHNLGIVEGNLERTRERVEAERDRKRREVARSATQARSEGAIANLAKEYGNADDLACIPERFDPAVCNFSDADPIWNNIRDDVRPDWCVTYGGVWNGLAQYCVISPERAAMAPPPEPKQPGERYYLVRYIEQQNPFLLEKPVVRENCAQRTCIYRNVSLGECRRLGGLPYARPIDNAYSGSCAVHSLGKIPADINLDRAPIYVGGGPDSAGVSAAPPPPPAVNPFGEGAPSGISGSTGPRSAPASGGGPGRTGPAR